MDYVKGFRQELLQEGKSRHTVNNYLQAVLEYKAYVQNRYDRQFSAELMDEESVEYFKEYLLYITMSKPTAINSKISALNRFASYLIDSGQLSYNPVTRVQRVPVNPAEKDGRDDLAEDIQLLREVLHQHNIPRDIAIFELLYNTGISVSELCAIDVDDIILASTAGQLVIRHDQRGDRTLLLDENLLPVIESYLQVRPPVDSPRLFQGQRGSLGRVAVYRIIDKYAREARVNISPQDLRHQFCQELIKQGTDLSVVAELAGYRSLNHLRRLQNSVKARQ